MLDVQFLCNICIASKVKGRRKIKIIEDDEAPKEILEEKIDLDLDTTGVPNEMADLDV